MSLIGPLGLISPGLQLGALICFKAVPVAELKAVTCQGAGYVHITRGPWAIDIPDAPTTVKCFG